MTDVADFKCIDSINIVSEKESNNVSLTLAKQAMEGASNIFFLGCGFHKENMERLKINNCENKEFTSTSKNKISKPDNIFQKSLLYIVKSAYADRY